MKILLLTSGGDSPGMNACLHELTKNLTRFSKHEVFASLYGFQGLLDNNIIRLSTKQTSLFKHKAGSFIKSSRCLEFKREKGFNRALETLKQNQIEVVVVLGGDGSFKGCAELKNAGIKVLFIPSTIDKDLHYSTYSIGFDTAANACKTYIDNVRPTMQAFDRICIYEIMGRDNAALTNYVAELSSADVVLTNETLKKNDFDKVRKLHKEKPALTVLLQERLLPLSQVVAAFEEETGGGVRACVVGYVQRGAKPTKIELAKAKKFAKIANGLIKKNKFGFALGIDEKKAQNKILKLL